MIRRRGPGRRAPRWIAKKRVTDDAKPDAKKDVDDTNAGEVNAVPYDDEDDEWGREKDEEEEDGDQIGEPRDRSESGSSLRSAEMVDTMARV